MKTADVNLQSLKSETSVSDKPELFEKVVAKLNDGSMPPKGFPHP